ncbi:hypothetical protein NQ314_006805 [Rhamnusium bicolor]|uniref:Uncharacterized protein n=1 Tax=Rhamnusium bicolor TaxID=1586634 RepID=A0AAV8YXN6_9CUCU|nr:hypothetical protein NQ314_006805 [Rhamnusium bicolor]
MQRTRSYNKQNGGAYQGRSNGYSNGGNRFDGQRNASSGGGGFRNNNGGGFRNTNGGGFRNGNNGGAGFRNGGFGNNQRNGQNGQGLNKVEWGSKTLRPFSKDFLYPPSCCGKSFFF